MSKKPVVLIIRDGWGINPGGKAKAVDNGDATLLARTPFHDHLYATYPWGKVSGSGEDVGLPEGQMGNSEVGHLNLGAGRVVYQDLTRINKAIREGELVKNPVLQEALSKAQGKRIHFLGLISDGGVHSHQDHLVALCNAAKAAGVNDIMVHAITDGRDTSPKGGAGYLAKLEADLAASGANIATVIGRYFAMDRDKRWERNKLAWDAIVLGRGEVKANKPSQAIQEAYATETRGDEFLPPLIFSHANEQRVRDGDVIFWFNFRADRARQLSVAFLDPEFKGFDREVQPKVEYYTLTEYDATYEAFGVKVVFTAESMNNILGQVVSAAGLKQLRSAETEKYPHVTFFFNGGVETPFPGEDRYLAISPKEVPTYDQKPQMSGPDVAFEVYRRLENYDLVIVNFANPDMVGHTGIVEAGVHAVETIDLGVQLLVEKTLALGGKLFITADHGNCEQMRNEDGSPHTAHTTNLVHGVYVAKDAHLFSVGDGKLADVAPTLLEMLGVPQPPEMTGKSLLRRS
ncbi:phosphoglycerate mutase [Roseimicrobium gellanilyticum]|uniref:2,3-bisphosphoglycerate-independent phosphoglycerate mutase n=1 Tax=Roseimicrobium gellanilyticum TaxID=748857 RepID=A0A366HP25_9BACT|nr:2,3-bisphosphoglycerate-independent phosphoglycerate mutase [Roseimicrobium gellanilyticum]RBP43735.1 phosphoglycerate mutase [Roseimicrobium gellanilyticum]